MHWANLGKAQRLAALKAAYERGDSGGDLARKLSNHFKFSITRNAVIGMYTRNPDLKVSHPLRPPMAGSGPATPHRNGPTQPKSISRSSIDAAIAAIPDEAPKPKAQQPKKVQRTESYFDGFEALPVGFTPEEAAAYDASTPVVGLLDVRDGQCRWPVGEMQFCGHERRSGSSYCDHHHIRAHSNLRRNG